MAVKQSKVIAFNQPDFATHQKGDYAFRRVGAERALIGSLLVLPEKYPTVRAMLGDGKGMFWDVISESIWRAMGKLAKDQQPIDPTLLLDHLSGVMGNDRVWWQTTINKFLFDYTAKHAGNILNYAQSIHAASIRRQLDQQLQDARRKNADGELPDMLVPDFIAEVTTLGKSLRLAPIERAGESIMVDHARQVQDMQENPDAPRQAIATGIRELTDLFGGWQKGMLHVVAGMPNMGKTAALLSFALNTARRAIPAAYFGFADGSERRTVARILGMMSEVPSDVQFNGQMTVPQYQAFQVAIRELSTLPLYVDCERNTPTGIETELRTLRETGGVQIAFIDYYQRLETERTFDNLYDRLVYVSKRLVDIAKELNIPVIVGAQVPAKVKDRKDHRNYYDTDIADCTKIAQDADLIMFVHREHRFDTMVPETTGEFIVEKLRMAGKLGIASAYFNPVTSQFTNGQRCDEHGPMVNNDVPF